MFYFSDTTSRRCFISVREAVDSLVFRSNKPLTFIFRSPEAIEILLLAQNKLSTFFGVKKQSGLHFSDRRNRRLCIFRKEQAAEVEFLGEKKPPTFYFSDRRNCHYFIFRRWEAAENLSFVEYKPSAFYFSDRRNRRHCIFRREKAVESFCFRK